VEILWINHRCPRHPQAGGAEVHLLEIAKRLVKRGHEITLLSERYSGSPKEEVIDGILVKRFGGKYALHLYAPYFVLKRSEDYDVIIDDIAHAVPFFSYAFTRQPVVAIVHHVHQEVLEVEVNQPLRYIIKRAERFIRHYKRIVAVSRTTRKDLVEKLKVPSERVEVIYPGVDHEKYRPGEKAERPTLLWMGRMKRYKHPDHALRVFKLVREVVKEAEMIMVGYGEAFPEVKKLIREMKLSNIILTGRISEDEKVELLQKSWVMLCTSEMEGWGMTIMEAASCATPTVAYNVGALKETIINGKTGFLIRYGDIEGLARSVTILLEDENLRREISKHALEYSYNFDWEKSTIEFEEYLSNVVKEKGS